MLMMVYYCISTCIYKKTIRLLHSWAGQLIVFMSTMDDNKYIVSILASHPNSIILLDWVKWITTCRSFGCNTELMLTAVDNR